MYIKNTFVQKTKYHKKQNLHSHRYMPLTQCHLSLCEVSFLVVINSISTWPILWFITLVAPNLLNPLMLTAAKTSLTIFMKSFRAIQAFVQLAKYLKEKCWSEHYQQLSFKYFVKSFSIPLLSSKEPSIQTTIPGWTLKYQWVKILLTELWFIITENLELSSKIRNCANILWCCSFELAFYLLCFWIMEWLSYHGIKVMMLTQLILRVLWDGVAWASLR